jgi:tetratricopeptide (TPR) repeat protein
MTVEPTTRRKYPRLRAPKGILVGWKSAGQTTATRLEIMGLGGFYLHAANPPSIGSTIELVCDLPTGEVRARAIVRSSAPGKGMGIQFVQMRPEDRAKLNRYLARQSAIEIAPADALVANSRSANMWLAISPRSEQEAQRRFERDVRHLIELTGKGNYYQLLGVTAESPSAQVKKNYYSLARKFHPDSHEGDRELITRLKDLMVIIAEAYRTLENQARRAAYDKSLAAVGGFSMHREKTIIEDSIESWLKRANECLRAKNFVGSIVWLRKCVETAPDQALYRAMLARSLGTVPQYRNEAIEQFQKAIDLDPWRESVYVAFAELFESLQLAGRACAVYSKLLEINPTHAKACERIAALATHEKGEKPSPLISNLFRKKS